MKKAKIMLSAVAVVTIVGSAFAFKAHNAYNGTLFCTATSTVIPPQNIKYLTSTAGSQLFCTAAANTRATTTTIVVQNP